jgi:hypothetical protein
VSLSARALTQAAWILIHVESLAPAEVLAQSMCLVRLLVALELRRQRQVATGFSGDTYDLKSVLLMYGLVRQFVLDSGGGSGGGDDHARPGRDFRSTTMLLNDLLPRLLERPSTTDFATAVPMPPPGARRFCAYLFPTDTARLADACRQAFEAADPAWLSRLRRMLQGHRMSCCNTANDDDAACCGGCPQYNGQVLRMDVDTDGFATCDVCGCIGHNKRSCLRRSTATHIAYCLGTLIDPTKAARVRPRSAHLALFNVYQLLVALLYRWWAPVPKMDNQLWLVTGVARLRPVGATRPDLLLRLFNHVAVALQNDARLGHGMVIMANAEGRLYLEAAHAYDEGPDVEGQNRVRELRGMLEASWRDVDEDEDVLRAPPCPATPSATRTAVQALVTMSATANVRLRGELLQSPGLLEAFAEDVEWPISN